MGQPKKSDRPVFRWYTLEDGGAYIALNQPMLAILDIIGDSGRVTTEYMRIHHLGSLLEGACFKRHLESFDLSRNS
jgi:hypothetical protein